MGGSDEEENLIPLTPREHFLAHLFLNRAHPEHKGITKAHQAMFKGSVKQQNNRQFNSRFYQLIRERAFVKVPLKAELEDLYYNERLSHYKIGKIYKVSHTTVAVWCRLYNIKSRTSADNKWPIPPKEELMKDIQEGSPYTKTKEKYKVGRTLLYNWMNEYGIGPAQKRGLDAMKRIPPREELEALIVEGSKQKTKFAVMKEYGCGIKTALKWLRYYNIEVKKPKVRATLCCKMCGEDFEVRPYKTKFRKYCSPACAKLRYSC
tara:strand:+ start:68 stop:856 length:789 start_codon:yes stop_codon:yes gene_type:complete